MFGVDNVSGFFGGSGEGSPLVELLGADGGAEIVSSNGILDGNVDGNLEVSPLGE